MMDHSVYVLSVSEVAPQTLRIVVERPEGYIARPGEAADVSVDEDGWWDRPRPFHFRRHDDPECLEFIVRSHGDADPVMQRMAKVRRGDRLALSAPFGADTKDVFFGGWRRPTVLAAQAAARARPAVQAA